MSTTNLLELAKNGDPQAIATLLRRARSETGWFNARNQAAIKADWHGGQLNLRLFSPDAPPLEDTIAWMRAQLEALEIDSVQTVRIFGYREGEPAPIWSQSLDLASRGAQAELLPAHSAQDAQQEAHSAPKYDTLLPTLDAPQIDRFIVCGLGDLGQYCVLNLKRFALREFEIHVTAIDKLPRQEWEVLDFPNLLSAPPLIGDCRNDDMLLQAGVEQCRAILLVTNSESANIETAIAARRLNPQVRLIVRSSRQSLNQLLKQQLGNFAAFEPTELPAAAFALAGMRAGILGYFDIGNMRLQVVEQEVEPRDPRFDGILASTLHKKNYRLLSHRSASISSLPNSSLPRAFYQWQTQTRVHPGDRVAYIEVAGESARSSEPASQETFWQQLRQSYRGMTQRGFQTSIRQVWQWINAQRIRQVIGAGLLFAALLWLVTVGMLLTAVPGMTLGQATSVAAILLLGGYGDVFGGLSDPALSVPAWVQFFCLLVTIASLASVLGVLGLMTDSLLSARFDFLRKRPRLPKSHHIVLVGFGRVGQRVAALLQEFRQPIVAITENLDSPPSVSIPLLVGNPVTELAKVNLATAKSLIVVTEDQMLNLEVALLAKAAARQLDRDIRLVVRTYDQRFSDNLSNLLPDARTMAAYGLSGEVFAGAAFGENILGLFRLNNQTILVAEYTISAADTLIGKLLAQVAYGYSVVPIFHQRASQKGSPDLADFLMPPDDRRLQAGDRLILLASINGLRRIEHRETAPPGSWKLQAQKPLNQGARQEGSSILHRISGCELEQARAFTEALPGAIELSLYDYQADRLTEELSRQLPQVTLTKLS